MNPPPGTATATVAAGRGTDETTVCLEAGACALVEEAAVGFAPVAGCTVTELRAGTAFWASAAVSRAPPVFSSARNAAVPASSGR